MLLKKKKKNFTAKNVHFEITNKKLYENSFLLLFLVIVNRLNHLYD